MTNDSLPVPTIYKWPDMQKDSIAIDLALEELGQDAPIRDILARAQAIKETIARQELELPQ